MRSQKRKSPSNSIQNHILQSLEDSEDSIMNTSSMKDVYKNLSQSVSTHNLDSKNDTRTSSFTNNLLDPQGTLRGSLFQNPVSTNLMIPQMVFMGEEKFKKNLECFVCRAPFGTLQDRQHHCRLCGNSCCSLCSSRTINHNRSCDICFLKATQLSYEKKRRRFIKAMKEHIEKMDAFSRAGQQKILELDKDHEAERYRLEQETKSLKNEYNELLMNQCNQEEEKTKLLSDLKILNTLLEPKILLKEKLQIQELEMDQQLRQLDTDIFLQAQTLEEKKKHFDKLRQHLVELENSQSFIDLSIYQEVVKIDPNNIAEKLISISKPKAQNISLTSSSYAVHNPNQMLESTQANIYPEPNNQMYDIKMLDQNQINDIMLDNKEPKKHNIRQKNTAQNLETEGGCKEQCQIF